MGELIDGLGERVVELVPIVVLVQPTSWQKNKQAKQGSMSKATAVKPPFGLSSSWLCGIQDTTGTSSATKWKAKCHWAQINQVDNAGKFPD